MRKTALESWICNVEGIASLTRAELEALQLARLNEVLAREKSRGAFYAGLPERLSSLGALSSLPFTSPEALSRSGAGMLLVSQSAIERVITGVTSGTTGPAKRLFYSERDLQHTIGFFAAGISEFTRPGDTVMIAMPFSSALGLGDLIARAVESLGARALKTGMGCSYDALHAALQSEKPNVYIGMAVPLLSLLRCTNASSLRRALISGDACPPGIVASIEALLGAKLFPHYGSRECGLGGAVSCQAHEGMHLRENHIIAEIVTPEGCLLPEGDWGELVISTIGLEAQPLIRYRTGDRARILPEPCPCGGVTKRLEIASRIDPSQSAMSVLDERLFRFPWLIDYSVCLCGELASLTVLYQGIPDAQALCAAAQEVLPRFRFTAKLSPVQGSDISLYTAKRVFLSPSA